MYLPSDTTVSGAHAKDTHAFIKLDLFDSEKFQMQKYTISRITYVLYSQCNSFYMNRVQRSQTWQHIQATDI